MKEEELQELFLSTIDNLQDLLLHHGIQGILEMYTIWLFNHEIINRDNIKECRKIILEERLKNCY